MSKNQLISESLWWELLEHLKETDPQRVERALKEGSLRGLLDRATQNGVELEAKAAAMGADEVEQRLACLSEINPAGPENPKPMSPEGEALYLAFWEKADAEMEALPP